MRACGWTGAEAQDLSPAQLLWHTKRARLRDVQRDQRLMLVIGAASAGGDAGRKVARDMEAEVKRLSRRVAKPVQDEESETPRSQADFERMMKEDDDATG